MSISYKISWGIQKLTLFLFPKIAEVRADIRRKWVFIVGLDRLLLLYLFFTGNEGASWNNYFSQNFGELRSNDFISNNVLFPVVGASDFDFYNWNRALHAMPLLLIIKNQTLSSHATKWQFCFKRKVKFRNFQFLFVSTGISIIMWGTRKIIEIGIDLCIYFWSGRKI